MTPEIVFYFNPMSRSRVVRWMLEEIQQPYRAEMMGFGTSMKAPEYLAINPMGKVPALRHGDTIITETAAICAYLADAFPDAKLAPPAQDPLRGAYYRWLFFVAGPLEAAVSNKSLGFAVPSGKEGMIGYGTYAHVMDTLEAAVSKSEYLVGNHFTAADLYVGSHLGFGMQFGSIEKRPAFERYYARIAARPAAVRARQIDDALTPEMKKS